MYRITLCLLALFTSTGCLVGSGDLVVEQPEEPIVISTVGDTTPATSSNPTSTTNPTSNPSDPSTTPTQPSDPAPTDPMCAAGEALCEGVCVGTTENDANCGDCGNVCDGGRVCMASACECEVGDFCGGTCVDTTSTSAHCGQCDRQCAGGEACVAGDCMVVGEVEGVLIAVNAARATGANCGSSGSFGPANPLEGDPNLHIAAQAHADDMAANNYFSHTGSDGSSFVDRIGRTAFSGQPIGENIAAGNRTAEATVQQWLDSDGHCANMMNPNATRIGVGFALGGAYGTLWVQVFGR